MSSMSKNWLSRVMALILAVVMALGLLTGCGESLDEKDTTAAPEQTTPGEEVTDVPTEAPKVEISYPLEGEAAIL